MEVKFGKYIKKNKTTYQAHKAGVNQPNEYAKFHNAEPAKYGRETTSFELAKKEAIKLGYNKVIRRKTGYWKTKS